MPRQTSTMQYELTDYQWQVAHAIAQTWVKDQQQLEPGKEGIKSELGKAIAYLQSSKDAEGSRFFTYLRTLVKQGNSIGHSGKTIEYYACIEAACLQYLKDEPAEALLQILGWAERLMQYYKTTPIGEVIVPSAQSARQAAIAAASGSQTLAVEQIVEATVQSIRNVEVTYEIHQTAQKLSQKEHKKAAQLQPGQTVKVKITDLKPDGAIKKIKLVE